MQNIIVKQVVDKIETENGDDYVASNIVDEHGNAEGCFGNVPFKNEVVFTKYPKGLHGKCGWQYGRGSFSTEHAE